MYTLKYTLFSIYRGKYVEFSTVHFYPNGEEYIYTFIFSFLSLSHTFYRVMWIFVYYFKITHFPYVAEYRTEKKYTLILHIVENTSDFLQNIDSVYLFSIQWKDTAYFLQVGQSSLFITETWISHYFGMWKWPQNNRILETNIVNCNCSKYLKLTYN